MTVKNITNYINHISSVESPFIQCTNYKRIDLLRNELTGLYNKSEFFCIDGEGLKDWVAFSNTISKEFNFPDYYGENWNAFNDCMKDLSWIKFKKIFLLIVNSEKLFMKSKNDMNSFVSNMSIISRYWSEEFYNDTRWDHPPIAFHTLLHSSKKNYFRTGCVKAKL